MVLTVGLKEGARAMPTVGKNPRMNRLALKQPTFNWKAAEKRE